MTLFNNVVCVYVCFIQHKILCVTEKRDAEFMKTKNQNKIKQRNMAKENSEIKCNMEKSVLATGTQFIDKKYFSNLWIKK